MSITILHQVYDETKRLAIAGSQLSTDDFRLKKLIAPLEEAGKKAPVFAKIAANMQKVIDAKPKESAQALLDLASLVSAVLYTQGQTKLAGDFKHVAPVEVAPQNSKISSKRLRAISEAFTQTGSGRLEVIEEAFESGDIFEIRLMRDAVFALDDGYAEIADFVAEKVLPKFGPPIVPLIKDNINIKGRGGNIRRLRLFNLLAPELAKEVTSLAMNKGSQEMKIACMPYLNDDLALLHKYAKGRGAKLRRAAFEKLLEFTDEKTENIFIEALSKHNLQDVVKPMAKYQGERLLDALHQNIRDDVATLVAGSDESAVINRTAWLLHCMRERKDPKSVSLLTELFMERNALSHKGGMLRYIDDALSESHAPELLRILIENRHSLVRYESAVHAAIEVLSPEECYDTLSQDFDEYSAATRSVFAEHTLFSDSRFYYDVASFMQKRKARIEMLDPRWMQLAIEKDNLKMVEALAFGPDDEVHNYLSERLEDLLANKTGVHGLEDRARVMITTSHPKMLEYWVKVAKKLNEKHLAPYYFYEQIQRMPLKTVLQLKDMLSDFPERIVKAATNQIDEAIEKSARKRETKPT